MRVVERRQDAGMVGIFAVGCFCGGLLYAKMAA